MAQPGIAPININPSLQTEAAAGNKAVVFTSADRKVIKERSGQDEIDRTRSFREIFTNRELAPKVENEQSSVKPEQDVRVLEARQRQFRKMLKHSVITAPREHVKLSGEATTPQPPIEMAIDQSAVTDGKTPAPVPAVNPDTAAAMKQLNLDPAELFHHRIYHPLYLVHPAEVGREGKRLAAEGPDRCGGCLKILSLAAGDDYLCPGLGEAARYRLADPATATGNDGHFSA